MNTKQKIISCIGNLNAKSTAIICNITVNYVYSAWRRVGYYNNKYNEI